MTSTLTQQLLQVIINHLLGGFIDESKYKFANKLKYSDKNVRKSLQMLPQARSLYYAAGWFLWTNNHFVFVDFLPTCHQLPLFVPNFMPSLLS
jgi:hypothetical protein